MGVAFGDAHVVLSMVVGWWCGSFPLIEQLVCCAILLLVCYCFIAGQSQSLSAVVGVNLSPQQRTVC